MQTGSEYSEKVIRKRLKLDRRKIKKIRQDVLGDDDWEIRGKDIVYSEAGLGKLLQYLGIGDVRKNGEDNVVVGPLSVVSSQLSVATDKGIRTTDQEGVGVEDELELLLPGRTHVPVKTYSEDEIIKRFGITKRKFKKAREACITIGDKSWDQELLYYESAIVHFEEYFDAEKNKDLIEPRLKENDEEELTVWDTDLPNKKLLIAQRGELELYRVKVRDSRNFVKWMKLNCYFIKGDLWEFRGKLPRSRGKW